MGKITAATFSMILFMALAAAGCSSGSGDGPAPAETGVPTGAAPAAAPPADDSSPDETSSGEPVDVDSTFEPVSQLLVLGDSLSDTGNAAALVDFLLDQEIRPSTVGLCNPADVLVLSRPCDDLFYGRSRVTDGPTAVERLAAELGLGELAPSMHLVPGRPMHGNNYAVASAKARAGNPEDLAAQIDWLLLDHALLASDALVVVMIGGNDAIDALKAGVDDPVQPYATSSAIVTAAVDAIGDGIERLLDFGARRLVVANVPDLAALPGVRAEAAAGADTDGVLALATAVSNVFDDALDATLDSIEASGAWDAPTPPEIVRFDLRATLELIAGDVASAGGNFTDACFDSEHYHDSQIAERLFHADCEPTAGGPVRFEDFVFWDVIHPTGMAHAAIGESMAGALPGRSPP